MGALDKVASSETNGKRGIKGRRPSVYLRTVVRSCQIIGSSFEAVAQDHR